MTLRTIEASINCMVVDSHQHFWDPDRFDYVWMNLNVQPLIRSFLPEDILPLLSQSGVHRTVVVQAISSLAEARWLLDLASANEFIGGVVTWCDLTSASLGKDLDTLQSHPKFKGVRHQIEDEPDDAWITREDVLMGLSELERRGIPYDLLVRPRHLKFLPVVRERCPHLKLVIDHIAKPRIAEREIDAWARDLERVAELPDVWCKLSGMNTEANWKGWTPSDLLPYAKHVVDRFGYERVMFGSDWPVCTLAGTYQQTVDALQEILGPLPESETCKVWGGNASEFYQLGLSTG
jgi:L-fuconolactonase